MNKNLKKIAAKALRIMSFLPKKWVCAAEYYYHLHRFPNLKNPQRFTEWIQWYKLNYRNDVMHQCVDKYEVRNYVKSKGCASYLNELYFICEDARTIDFAAIPNQFVIKTTDGGNGDNVFVCRDKSKIDIDSVIKNVNGWRNRQLGSTSGEWAYSGNYKSRVIVEKYLEDPHSLDGSIDDYKLLCFHGKFRYLWIDKNRFSNHKRGFWDENLNFMAGVKSDHPTFDEPPKLPDNLPEMISVAEKLSADFPFARVDFYDIDGRITFGEITFYPWSGYVKYTPDSFDYELGKHFITEV